MLLCLPGNHAILLLIRKRRKRKVRWIYLSIYCGEIDDTSSVKRLLVHRVFERRGESFFCVDLKKQSSPRPCHVTPFLHSTRRLDDRAYRQHTRFWRPLGSPGDVDA